MYDAAHLPFEENIKATRQAVRGRHYYGIPVEAELGKIPDAGEEVDWPSYYTDVAEAERFVAETGVDWLAISVGIVHGVPHDHPAAAGHPADPRHPRRHRIPLVLHGASGVPDDEIKAATEAGVAKFNADTDLRHAFRAGIEDDVVPG